MALKNVWENTDIEFIWTVLLVEGLGCMRVAKWFADTQQLWAS